MRVGFWRLRKMLERSRRQADGHHQRQDLRDLSRRWCEACVDSGWELNAHSYEQIPMHKLDDQRARHRQDRWTSSQKFSGKRPRGWFGPGLTQTFDTLDYLAEAGVEYIGDWVLDDEPVTLKTKHESRSSRCPTISSCTTSS